MNAAIRIALATLLLSGCASVPQVRNDFAGEYVSTPAPPPPSSGAIFRPQHSVGLFEDRRARQIGDVLTVILSERTQAQKSAATSTSKDSSIGVEVPTLLGGTGVAALVDSDVTGSTSFDGSADSTQSNLLTGSITVVVTETLPNGALRVAGEKRLDLNQGSEYVRLTGIVRPEDVAPDNTVMSTRIAQAQISYKGAGALADANRPGWLTRIFQSVLSPF